MKRIGLIGEDPNDTTAIRNLLMQKHSGALQFKQLIKNKKGGQLNNRRVTESLKIEYLDYKPHFVLFIRDADAIITEKDKINKVVNWFSSLNPYVENKGILLINIYELEALILADIEVFNSLYKTDINYSKNVMYQNEPKEFLISKTAKGKKRYSESHAPEIFEKLRFDNIIQNCEYFKSFHVEFKKVVKL